MMNIINSINNVLTKGELLLHIEPTSTAIKSVLKINYKLYILTKDNETPKEILFFSSTLTPGNVISDLDEWATQEILKFVIHGGLRDYE